MAPAHSLRNMKGALLLFLPLAGAVPQPPESAPCEPQVGEMAEDDDGVCALQVGAGARGTAAAVGNRQMPWGQMPPACECQALESDSLAKFPLPICMKTDKSQCYMPKATSTGLPDCSGGALCSLPKDGSWAKHQGSGQSPPPQTHPSPDQLPGCDCQDYRPHSLQGSPGPMCMGPRENWGRPCYQPGAFGECSADKQKCVVGGIGGGGGPAAVAGACTCARFHPRNLAQSTGLVCQEDAFNGGSCYSIGLNGQCDSGAHPCTPKVHGQDGANGGNGGWQQDTGNADGGGHGGWQQDNSNSDGPGSWQPDDTNGHNQGGGWQQPQGPVQVSEGIVRPAAGERSLLERAGAALDVLPNKADFDNMFSGLKLPVTLGIVNDLDSWLVQWVEVDALEITDGHKFAGPPVGTRVQKGDMIVVQSYSKSTGSAGRMRLKDNMGNKLVIAFGSYRVGNFMTGCDALKVEAVRSDDMGKAESDLCHLDGPGLYKLNDYEVLVSIKSAE